MLFVGGFKTWFACMPRTPCLYVSVRVRERAYVFALMSACVCACVWVYVDVRVCACVCVYVIPYKVYVIPFTYRKYSYCTIH